MKKTGLGFALLLAASMATAGDWPSMGRDAGRSRSTPDVIAPPISAAWSQAFGEATVASPVSADGLVLAVSLNAHKVRALHEADGTVAWTRAMPGDLAGTPAIDAGRVFLPCGDGHLYCLSFADGSTLWTAPIGFTAFSSPTVADGVVFVGSGFPDKLVKAFDEATGALAWSTPTDQLIYSSPAVSNGAVYIGTTSGTAYAMDAATGAILWTFPTGGQFLLSSPMVRGDRVWLFPGRPEAPGGATLFGVNADSQKWSTNIATPIGDPSAPTFGQLIGKNIVTSSPASAGSWIVATVRFDYYLNTDAYWAADTYVMHEYAIGVDAATGAPAWQVSISSKTTTSQLDIPLLGSLSTPAAFSTPSGAAVAVASSIDAWLRVFSAQDGSYLDGIETNAPSRSSPAVSNGLVIHANDTGAVTAFRGTLGSPPDAVTSGFAASAGNPPTLSWDAPDPGTSLRYFVRLDDDGEVSSDWDVEIQTAFNETHATLPAPLIAGQAYAWAVRPQDEAGAMGPWSDTQVFTMTATIEPAPAPEPYAPAPEVSINGEPVTDLASALAIAGSGDIIELGAGTYAAPSDAMLTSATIIGAGPRDTIIVRSSAGGSVLRLSGDASISRLTIAGGDVGVSVVDGRATLENVIVRDSVTAGIALTSSAASLSVNLATVVHNGVGIDIEAGTASITNSIFAYNGIALIVRADAMHAYNDYFENGTALDGAELAATEFQARVSFVDPASNDYREVAGSATIDAGDPAEAYDREPESNGDRVNLGAFGNTEQAATSAMPSSGSGGGGAGGCSAAASKTGGEGTAATLVSLIVLAAFGIRRTR